MKSVASLLQPNLIGQEIFVTFTVRFVIHRSRRTGFRNPEIAEDKITNIANEKLHRKFITNIPQLLKGMHRQVLLGDIFGTMRSNVSKLSDTLET